MQLLILFYPINKLSYFFVILKLLKNKKSMAGGRFELPKAFATGYFIVTRK